MQNSGYRSAFIPSPTSINIGASSSEEIQKAQDTFYDAIAIELICRATTFNRMSSFEEKGNPLSATYFPPATTKDSVIYKLVTPNNTHDCSARLPKGVDVSINNGTLIIKKNLFFSLYINVKPAIGMTLVNQHDGISNQQFPVEVHEKIIFSALTIGSQKTNEYKKWFDSIVKNMEFDTAG